MKVDNIMIGIRIEDGAATRLRNLGLKYVFRTKREQEALASSYGQGFKRYNGHRGHPLVDEVDSQLYTSDGQDNVSFRYILNDMKQFGYQLMIAEILRNEGRGYILRLFFNRERGNVFIEAGVLKEIEKILQRAQRRVFGFFHEQSLTMDDKVRFTGSIITLNATMGYLNHGAQAETSIQFIRVIDQLGRVQCQPASDDFAENLRLELGLSPLTTTESSPLAAVPVNETGEAQE